MSTPTPFSATPNTAASVVKTLAWATSLETSKAGHERRDPARAVPRLSYSAGYVLESADIAALRVGSVFSLPAHPLLPAGDYELTESAELEHMRYGGQGLAAVALEWLAVENTEAVPLYTGPTSEHGGLFLFPPSLADGRLQPRDRTTWSAHEFDEGHVRSRKLRYRKRTTSVLVTLTNEAELATFYSFLHAMRGRFGAFRWQHFIDTDERTWRLASDSVAFTFHRANLCEAELRLTELEFE